MKGLDLTNLAEEPDAGDAKKKKKPAPESETGSASGKDSKA